MEIVRARQYILTAMVALLPFISTSATAADGSNAITGAGAHFAWVIFDKLKPELENEINREIILYGRNSMLGQGCNAGIKSATQHSQDKETFGFVCCELTDDEVKKNNISVYPLAQEPIHIIVNKKNPVSDLSSEQVKAIFRGDITNWKAINGKDLPIVVITRLHCKKRPGHWKTILPSPKEFSAKRLNVNSADDMENRVSAFDGAIGHIGAVWNFGTDKTKTIKVNGKMPTGNNLKNQSYPFYRTLSAVSTKEPSKDVLRLIKKVKHGDSFNGVVKKYSLLKID